MTVVKINAITVGPDSGDELARRFAARAGAVDGQDGFEGFELLRPTDDRTTWLVVTRWRDEESFQAWLSSRDFRAAHGDRAGKPTGADDTGSVDSTADTGTDEMRAPEQARPVGLSAELWGYEVVDL
ncbi:MAG: antibiotic biosynthesis monooxygenase [Dermatophilaceae bacterium]|nr:antibiotic biosynthesis monooxygenase [Intrasporangiaceae bacterium]